MPIKILLYFFWILPLLCGGCYISVENARKKILAQKSVENNTDSIVNQMLRTYPIVLKKYSTPSGRGTKAGFPVDYAGISANGGILIRLSQKKAAGQGTSNFLTTLDSIKFPTKKIQMIVGLFKSNKWNLTYNDIDTAGNYCFWQSVKEGQPKQCDITDRRIYYLGIFTNNAHTNSYLYAPDYYETNCCQGNLNRINFLKINTTINNLWNKTISKYN
jgi:hypothetical protein